MVRVAVTGATGRMGRTVLETAAEREDVDAVVAVSESDPSGAVAGTDVLPAGDLEALLVEREAQALVDFTVPGASRRYVEAAAAAGVPAVVGTTGFGEDARAALADASERVPVLRAPNFARGVAAIEAVAGELAAALPDYDVELVETHHAGKRDAPSGTASRLLEAVEEGRGREGERVHGREGVAPRGDEEVGVHAVRAGDVTGVHELLLAGNRETVRLTHRAGDRAVFAEGALDAAAWLAGREPGRYDYADVLGVEG